MKALLLLLLLLPHIPLHADIYSDGWELIQTKQVREAWQLLMPLAKKGDMKAQYMLGAMLVSNPEVPNNLSKAKKLITASANQGYGPAKRYLSSITAMEKAVDPDKQPTTILGKTVTPASETMDEMNSRFSTAKKKKLPSTLEQAAEVQLLVFVPDDKQYFGEWQRSITPLQTKYGARFVIKYIVPVDPPTHHGDFSSSLPSKAKDITPGVIGDVGNKLARKYGVSSIPVAVILPKDAPPILSSRSDLQYHLSSIL